jgi:hypothetical protein
LESRLEPNTGCSNTWAGSAKPGAVERGTLLEAMKND